jgi:hypothetical protein
MDANKYQQAIVVITKEQEKIIGKNLAKQLIRGVSDLEFDQNGNPELTGNADPKEVLSELVDQYATLFGRASIEVSKEAVKNLDETFSSDELPENLR